MLRLAYKKLRQSRSTEAPCENDEVSDEVEGRLEPPAPPVDEWDASLDDIICFDMT